MKILDEIEEKLTKFRDQCGSKYTLPELRIGTKHVNVPIVQGGMGVCISLSGLASAVAREGGIGVIAANAIGMIDADYYQDPIKANVRTLRNEIRKARNQSQGYIGVNIMVAVDCFNELLQASIEEKVDFLFLGAGLPIKNIPVQAIRDAEIQVIPIVSSGRAAKLIFKSWEKHYHDIPDGVVVEGPKAGGHLGFKTEQIDNPDFQLEQIVPEVVEALKEFEIRHQRDLPVIAAGGIYTGEDIFRIMKLGAKGVQMGTRFVATIECDADIHFKETYINCRPEDITIISSPVGLPGRAIKSDFLDDIARGVKKFFRCPSHCLESCGAKNARYCISEALISAQKGEISNGFAFCGSNAWRVDAILPVKKLISTLKFEYSTTCLLDSIQTDYETAVEKLTSLKTEYSQAIAAARVEIHENIRRRNAQNERLIQEKIDQIHLTISQLKGEYNSIKAKVNELNDELMILLGSHLNMDSGMEPH